MPESVRRTVTGLSERYGVPGVDLDGLQLDLADLDAVPQEIARRHVVLPLLLRADALFLAMATPSDTRAIQEVEFVSGRKVFAFVAEADRLSGLIDVVYAARASGAALHVGPRVQQSVPAQPATQRPAATPTPRPHGARASSVPTGLPPAIPRRGAPTPPPRGAPAATKLAMPGPPRVPQEFAGRDDASASAAPARPAPPPPLPGSDRPSMVARPPSVASTGKRVWVVDADAESREALCEALTELGHLVVALDGTGALWAHRSDAQLPHLVVVDPADPTDADDGLGHSLQRWAQLLEDPRWMQVPSLMLTTRWRGWRAADDLGELLGVKALIAKPLSLVDTVSRIEAALDGHDPRRPNEPIPPGVEAALQASTEAYQRGQPEEAVHALEVALQHPAHASGAHHLRYQLGLLFGKRGEVYRAIAALEAAVEADEAFFPALKNLAVLYERAGFRRKALEAWERAHFVAPDANTRGQIQDRILALLQPE